MNPQINFSEIKVNQAESVISVDEQGLRISVCLITKDEEKYIENCLKSVLPIAFEVIVLDTGSADRTMEIVKEIQKSYPQVKLFETKWQDDFSLARNESISYATGDWIFFLGSDEVLMEKTRNNLLPFLSHNQEATAGTIFCFKIINPQPGELLTTSYFRQALFKNQQGIYFERPVHEQLNRPEKDLHNINCPFFTIYHFGQLKSPEELKGKTEKYKKQLLAAIKNNPDKSDNYYYYHHLGNAFSLNNQPNETLEAFEKALKIFRESGREKRELVHGTLLVKLASEFIYNHQKYEEAIPLLDELLEISPDFPDALFYKAYCLQNLGSERKGMAIYEKLLELFSEDIDLNPLGIVSQEKSFVPAMLLEMGSIAWIEGEKQKSLVYLEYAYKISPDAPPVLYHLLKFNLLENNVKEAVDYYINSLLCSEEEKENLKNFTENQSAAIQLALLQKLELVVDWTGAELKSIKEKISELSVFVNPTISICMITKDEEKYIENCLKSVLSIAFEVIVLDTGSSDRTIEIVKEIQKSYPQVKLFETKWQDNFSKARNESIIFATGNWVLWIDADEVLTDNTRKKLIPFLSETKFCNEPVVFSFKNLNSREGNLVDSSYFKQNLFRNGHGLHFISPIHEHLAIENGQFREIDCPEFAISHSGNYRSEAELEAKTNRYINILFKILENGSEENRDYFYYHHLGDSYANLKKYDRAVEFFNLAYQSSRQKANTKYSNDLLITIIKELLFIHERYNESLSFIEKLVENFPDLPDLIFFRAYVSHQSGNYSEAVRLYQEVLQTDNNLFLSFQNKGINTIGELLPVISSLEMGRCFLLMGENENGLNVFRQCLKNNPGFLPVLFHLTRFYLLQDDLPKAVFYYLKTGQNFSEAEILNFEEIATLSPETIQYQSVVLKLLKEIEYTPGFTEMELVPVKNKLKQISPKVSVCLVTNNNENTIERCLKSLLPVAEEIIILDTGSKDLTREIASKFGKVFVKESENDQSKLKNQAFEHTTGEWIFNINPNEYLSEDSRKNLLPFLFEQPYHDIPIVFCPKILENDADFIFPVSSFRDNIFKNGFGIKSVRPVSDHLYLAEGNLSMVNCPFIKIDSDTKSLPEINKLIQALLTEIAKENPDNYYYYLNLGDTYKAAGDSENGLKDYITSYDLFNQAGLPKNNPFYGNILSKLLREMVFKKKDYQKAIKYCQELLNISPTFQDGLFYMAFCRQNTGDISGALEIYEYTYDLFLRENVNPLGICSLEDNIILYINREMGNCYIQQGDRIKGEKYLEQARIIAPV